MSTDLSDAWIDAAAEPIWDYSNPEYPIQDGDAWQECRDLARQVLEAAASHIEAAVRAKVAEEIGADCRERHDRLDGDPCDDCARNAAIALGQGRSRQRDNADDWPKWCPYDCGHCHDDDCPCDNPNCVRSREPARGES